MDGRVLIASYQVFPLQPARVNSIFSMQPSRPGRNQEKKNGHGGSIAATARKQH